MEGDVGEDEERVRMLRQLLEPGHVVLPGEGEVDQEAEQVFRFNLVIRIPPTLGCRRQS